MRRILIAVLVLLFVMGVVFASSSTTHSVALAPHTTYVVVADANDGSGNDGGWSGDGTDGGWSGDGEDHSGNGGDQTNH
jgi:uncharacterized membrane protein YgcG